MLPRFSAPVSGVDCPCPFFHANCLLLLASLLSSRNWPLWVASSTLSLSCPAATALCWVASSTLIRVPLPLPDTARFHVQESFVWFRAKTDSSALAAYPHSATIRPLPATSGLDITLNHSMVRLQPRRFVKYEVALHHHYFLVHSDYCCHIYRSNRTV